MLNDELDPRIYHLCEGSRSDSLRLLESLRKNSYQLVKILRSKVDDRHENLFSNVVGEYVRGSELPGEFLFNRDFENLLLINKAVTEDEFVAKLRKDSTDTPTLNLDRAENLLGPLSIMYVCITECEFKVHHYTMFLAVVINFLCELEKKARSFLIHRKTLHLTSFTDLSPLMTSSNKDNASSTLEKLFSASLAILLRFGIVTDELTSHFNKVTDEKKSYLTKNLQLDLIIRVFDICFLVIWRNVSPVERFDLQLLAGWMDAVFDVLV